MIIRNDLTIACDAAGRNASYKVVYLNKSQTCEYELFSLAVNARWTDNIQQHETLHCPCLTQFSIEGARAVYWLNRYNLKPVTFTKPSVGELAPLAAAVI